MSDRLPGATLSRTTDPRTSALFFPGNIPATPSGGVCSLVINLPTRSGKAVHVFKTLPTASGGSVQLVHDPAPSSGGVRSLFKTLPTTSGALVHLVHNLAPPSGRVVSLFHNPPDAVGSFFPACTTPPDGGAEPFSGRTQVD